MAIIVLIAQNSRFMYGQTLAGWIIEAASLALGVIAAILLMIAWSPAADRRQARQIRGLPLVLLGVAVLSQIPVLIFHAELGFLFGFHFAQGNVGVLVALAVAWYAMSLRRRTLGGALMLGWITAAAMWLSIETTQAWGLLSGALSFYVILGYVLLAAVVVLTIIYMRKPSELEASPA